MKTTIVFFLLGVLISISACTTPPTDEEVSLASTANSDPCVQDMLNNVPQEHSRCPDAPDSDAEVESSVLSMPLCSETTDLTGEKVTCAIIQARCSYQPATEGSPTFCNDIPYPNHNFTLVVWGDDWSDYNGKCIEVSGVVSIYLGKPQIEATNRAQVKICD